MQNLLSAFDWILSFYSDLNKMTFLHTNAVASNRRDERAPKNTVQFAAYIAFSLLLRAKKWVDIAYDQVGRISGVSSSRNGLIGCNDNCVKTIAASDWRKNKGKTRSNTIRVLYEPTLSHFIAVHFGHHQSCTNVETSIRT